MAAKSKAGRATLPANNPSYDPDGPGRPTIIQLLESLAEKSPQDRKILLSKVAHRSAGGFVRSFMVERGMLEDEEERAGAEIAEIQLDWLERLGGCRIEGDLVYAAAQTVHIPKINGRVWSPEITRPYTVGDDARDEARRENHNATIEAWNDVLFKNRRSRTVDGTVWTRKAIFEAIEAIRGPLDDDALTLIVGSMDKWGYDEAYPILVWKGEGYDVDGRHRRRASEIVGVEPAVYERAYKNIQAVLGASVVADEARKGWDAEAAELQWTELGLSLREIRADTGLSSAELRRVAAENRRGQRERKKEGTNQPVGRPASREVDALAADIAARQATGEKVNITAAAKAAGIPKTTLYNAIARVVPKSDMSGFGTAHPQPDPAPGPSPAPQPDENPGPEQDETDESPPPALTLVEPEPETVTCSICGRWDDPDLVLPLMLSLARKKESGYSQISPARSEEKFAHESCWKRLPDEKKWALVG